MIVRPSFRRCLGLLRIWDRALLEVAPRRPPLGHPPAPRRPRGLARAASPQPARAVSGRVGGGGSLPSRGCLGSGRGRLRGPSGFSPERPPSGFGLRGPRGCRAARRGFALSFLRVKPAYTPKCRGSGTGHFKSFYPSSSSAGSVPYPGRTEPERAELALPGWPCRTCALAARAPVRCVRVCLMHALVPGPF